jgi:transposase-like protein
MPKPYSQDLRERVIDALERGKMSRRAAARRYEISESAAIKWLERVERDGSREPVGHGGHHRSDLPCQFSKRDAQSETASPLLILACTRPSIMNVGDTWTPFWRPYLLCHLISRSRSGSAKASRSWMPL